MWKLSRNKINKEFADIEVVVGIQCNDKNVEHAFYTGCKRYFNERKGGVFNFRGGAHEEQDLFHDAFLKLWQEIQTRQIYVSDNALWRIDRKGNRRCMSASLKTYLLAIAKYKNYELIREDDIYVSCEAFTCDQADNQPEDYTFEWIVDMCVNALPKRCKEILTLFYYENKSLDEILSIRNENQSKDGLKTGKSKCMKSLKDKITAEYERRTISYR